MSDFWDKIIGNNISWKDLRKLLEYDVQTNRTDRGGPFVGWEWGKQVDEFGNPILDEFGNQMKTDRQGMSINPAFQPAVTRLGNRASSSAGQMPPGMNELYGAKMATQMQRHGLDTSAYLPPFPPDQGVT